MSSLLADARLALRGLRKAPVFTMIAVLSIALGIGANTAIFALVDQVLLRVMPVKAPHELVLLQARGSHSGSSRGDQFVLSYPMYRDFAAHNAVFSGMFCRFGMDMHVGAVDAPSGSAATSSRARSSRCSGSRAAAGRTLGADDDRTPGAHPVAGPQLQLLEEPLPERSLDRRPEDRGERSADDRRRRCAGGFEGVDLGSVTRVFIPIAMKAQMTPQWNDLDNRRSRWVHIFGRLKPGVTAEQARAALQPFFTTMLQNEVKEPFFSDVSAFHRDRFVKGTIHVQSGAQGRVGIRRDLTQPLWVLMAIVGGVLLIA